MNIFIEGIEDFNQEQLHEFHQAARDQVRIIVAKEEKARLKKLVDLNRISILRITADYYEWLIINKRGSSFSTFVEEFGFDSVCASEIYKAIKVLFEVLSEGVVDVTEYTCLDVEYPKPPYLPYEGE